MTTMTRIGNRFEMSSPNARDALIGQGGMGAVYHGTDTMTQTPVAVKLLKSELLARDPDMVHRFEREGDALRKLNHPNIVKMLGAFEENGIHYLIMEYVPGGSLRDVLHQQPQLTVQRTLYTALDLADALTRAHRLDILHRDIKPDNVLIADDGTPRLTDFGMARMGNSHITQDGAIVGTLSYLSPESFNGAEPDPRTDIWSFGVMLYEMLAGERPYPHEQPGVLVNAIMTHPIPDLEAIRPDAPTGLIDLIYRMLKKDPDARIPSVRLVGAELEAIIQGGGNTTIQAVVSPDIDGRFENITPTPRPNLPTNRLDVPNNLPQQPTPFVGREKEVADIKAMLESDNTRMITLLGTGGIGKTRIALEAAKTQLRIFKDGVYFIPLATESSRDIVPVAIGDTIGMTFGGGDARLELEDFLREKHMLLVLDNFETLTQCAEMMAGILKIAPGVKMLITSRERLRLRSEQIYDIEPMHVPGRYDTTADRLRDNAAVQLFVQSARRMMPDFMLDDDNAGDVATIVRQVHGLPLGIELAAAWLETLAVDEIVEEIEESLDFLETDFQDVPERQRSLRAVFEYSWNKLSDAEKEVFLKLSVFRGGFEREAAKQVTGASLKVLTGLVNKSLLRREHTGRYFAHSVLKQYAEDLFDDDEARNEAYKNHAWYYGQFVRKLRPALDSDKEAAAYDAIDIELENLRAAWLRGIEQQRWDDLNGISMLMTRYFVSRSLVREGSEALAALADALHESGNMGDIYWRARLGETYMRSFMGDYDAVLETSQAALDYFMANNRPFESAMALNHISYVHTMQGDYETARQVAIEAEKIAEISQYPMIKYKSKMALAYLDYLTGDYDSAMRIYEELLEESKHHDMSSSLHADLKTKIGAVLQSRGDFEKAKTFIKSAYEIYKSYGNKRGMAYALNDLAGVIFLTGDYDRAEPIFADAYRLHKEVGDRNGIAHAISALGNNATVNGDYEKAKQCYRESLEIRRDLGDKRGIADSLLDLARSELNTGNMKVAEKHIDDVIKLREEIGDRMGIADAIAGRAMGLVGTGEIDRALPDIERVLELSEELDSGFLYVQGRAAKGEYLYQKGNYEKSLGYFLDVLERGSESNVQVVTMLALSGIAGILLKFGQVERALSLATIVQRYPQGFLPLAQIRAAEVVAEAEQLLSKERLSTITSESQMLVPQKVINGILTEFASA